MPRTNEPRRFRQVAGSIFLALWVPGLVVLVSALMATHWISLPRPDPRSSQLAAALHSLRPTDLELPGWTTFHFLYAECACSRRVHSFLIQRDQDPQAHDVFVIVGRDADLERACDERGLELHNLTPGELQQRFGIEAAPLLVVRDPREALAYIGGYSPRYQGTLQGYGELIDRLRRGETVTPHPVFGCGVALSLQRALDPLGLKYKTAGGP